MAKNFLRSYITHYYLYVHLLGCNTLRMEYSHRIPCLWHQEGNETAVSERMRSGWIRIHLDTRSGSSSLKLLYVWHN
jgi:hypothetical protein